MAKWDWNRLDMDEYLVYRDVDDIGFIVCCQTCAENAVTGLNNMEKANGRTDSSDRWYGNDTPRSESGAG